MPPECFLVDFERKSRKATSSWSRFLGSAGPGSGIREMERSQNRVDFCAWEPGRYQTHWDCWEWRNWSQTVLAVPVLELPGREAEWTNDSLRLRNPLSFEQNDERSPLHESCTIDKLKVYQTETRVWSEFGRSRAGGLLAWGNVVHFGPLCVLSLAWVSHLPMMQVWLEKGICGLRPWAKPFALSFLFSECFIAIGTHLMGVGRIIRALCLDGWRFAGCNKNETRTG
jgi:hypothetical protein